MQLRACLEQGAVDCGRGATFAEVQANLRAQFGLSAQQARDKLLSLRKEPGQTFYSLGVEVTRLVRLGYPEMPAVHQNMVAADTFKRAIDHNGLYRHLLALQANTVDAMVQAASEYFQVPSNATRNAQRGRHGVATLGREDGGEEGVAAVAPPAQTSTDRVLESLVKAVEQNTLVLQKLLPGQRESTADRSQSWRQGQAPPQPRSGCFKCGQVGHMKRDCPRNRQQQGNAGRPQ